MHAQPRLTYTVAIAILHNLTSDWFDVLQIYTDTYASVVIIWPYVGNATWTDPVYTMQFGLSP